MQIKLNNQNSVNLGSGITLELTFYALQLIGNLKKYCNPSS